MRPGYEMAVVGQELELKDQQDQHRGDRQRDPGHCLQEASRASRRARAASRRKSARTACWRGAGASRHCRAATLTLARPPRYRPPPSAQQQHLQQHIGVEDHEQDRREKEEADQRQIDVEDGQLDRVFEKKLAVRHRARRDDEIEPEDQKADPDRRDARRRVVERLFQRSTSNGSVSCPPSPPLLPRVAILAAYACLGKAVE